MQLLNFHDWLFCFATRARGALACCSSHERGSVTAAVALFSVLGSAAVFATTTLESGEINFDALAGAVDSSISRVSANLEVRGSVIARSADSEAVDRIQITIGVFGQGAVPIDSSTEGERLAISYQDASVYLPAVPYTVTFLQGDGDALLESGELASVAVDLSALPDIDLRANGRFTFEITAPIGGTVEISRTLPFALQPVMSLH